MAKHLNFTLTPLVISFTLFITACGGDSSSSNESFINQISVGRKLFFDETLSSNGTQSCASCHDPEHGFADPDATKDAPVSEGAIAGSFGNRNAPTVAYASFIPEFGLATDPGVDTNSKYQGGQFLDGRRNNLIEQAKDPFLNPKEMNNLDAEDVVNKVRNAAYANEFKQVFGEDSLNDIDTAYHSIATAIAAFEASDEVNSFSSKFDAVMDGKADFTPSELRGFNLFKGNKAKCANCHTLNDAGGDASLFTNFRYFNIGTPANPRNPIYTEAPGFVDEGLAANLLIEQSDVTAETGKFRTPTLRNIQLTAPYMHNGTYATLREVITHYDIQVADFISDPFLFFPEVDINIANELNVRLGLSELEYNDLENFLKTLTDG